MSDAFYDALLARLHHDHFGMVGEAGARTLLRLLDGETGRVLELGVGSGVSSRLLLDAGLEVWGVDRAPAMLALAGDVAPGGTYIAASLWTAPLPRGAVAVTAFGEVFNYAAPGDVPDPARLAARLRDVHEALRPGGWFVGDVTAPTRSGPDGERGASFRAGAAHLILEETEDPAGIIDRRIDTYAHVEGDLYRHQEERHRLVTFAPEVVEAGLTDAGFVAVTRLEAYDGYPFQPGWCGFTARRRPS